MAKGFGEKMRPVEGYTREVMLKNERVAEPAYWVDPNTFAGYEKPLMYGPEMNAHQMEGKV